MVGMINQFDGLMLMFTFGEDCHSQVFKHNGVASIATRK